MGFSHGKTGEQDRDTEKDQTLQGNPCYVDSRNSEQTYMEQTGVETASEAHRGGEGLRI